MTIQVMNDLFSSFGVELPASSTIKDLNQQIKSRSGLVNLLVKKDSPRAFMTAHLTLEESGLLSNPRVFACTRAKRTPLQKAVRRIEKGLTKSSQKHEQTLRGMAQVNVDGLKAIAKVNADCFNAIAAIIATPPTIYSPLFPVPIPTNRTTAKLNSIAIITGIITTYCVCSGV